MSPVPSLLANWRPKREILHAIPVQCVWEASKSNCLPPQKGRTFPEGSWEWYSPRILTQRHNEWYWVILTHRHNVCVHECECVITHTHGKLSDGGRRVICAVPSLKSFKSVSNKEVTVSPGNALESWKGLWHRENPSWNGVSNQVIISLQLRKRGKSIQIV
jgi:hypothetical protein